MTTTTNVLPLPEGVEKLPSGNFRFRLEHRGKVLRGTYGTPEEAAEVRAETKRAIALGHVELVEHGSIAELGPAFLKSREGNRGYATESRRWNLHIAKSSLGRRAARSISRRDVLRWLDELRAKMTSYDPKIHGRREPKPLAWETRKHCLDLLRAFFTWALDRVDGMVANPCADVRVEREDGDEDDGYQASWYLDVAEQERLLAVTLEDEKEHRRWLAERHIVKFAIGTGLRLGELCCLHDEDVHLDGATPYIDVKYGSWDKKRRRYRPPKGRRGEKRTRRVELFGMALEAARAWLAIRPTYAPHNPARLFVPTERGARREKPPRSWKAVVKAFGVVPRIGQNGRRPWWHLLRHTCASSLVGGWWGLRLSLEDVRAHLGHSSVKVTERYAHLEPAALEGVARRLDAAWQIRRHGAATTPVSSGGNGTNSRPSKPRVAGSSPAGRATRNPSGIRPLLLEDRGSVMAAIVGVLQAVADGRITFSARVIDALGVALTEFEQQADGAREVGS